MNPYTNALNAQSASNVLGLTKALAQDMQAIADASPQKPMSSEALAQHPVLFLYLTQLIHLAVHASMPQNPALPFGVYLKAYSACEALSKQWDVNQQGVQSDHTVQISQVAHGGLTAANLAQLNLVEDTYHDNIKRAAQWLVAQDKGDYRYLTQYTSGAMSWRDGKNPFVGGVMTITPDMLAQDEELAQVEGQ